MKQRNLRLTALALAMLMLVSVLLILTPAAQPAVYSSESNSGKRDEICTSLEGTGAADYYTGSYAYDSLAQLSPSSLQASLCALMTSTHTNITSYDDCRDLVFYVDCENNDTTHATTLYTDYGMTSADWTPTWSCNREHVWPQSLGGGGTTGGGADLHHIRPAEASVNSSRGNKPYGETTSAGFYEPADHVKGDVARIILYVYVRWNSDWGATDVTEVFESVDILLAWCELDPVDTWEMGRNEVVEKVQGNRNTFIDYPELAWLIFGREVPEGMVTPSLSAVDGEIPTQATDPETEAPTEPKTEAPEIPAGRLALFDLGENGGASHSDGTEITGTKSYTDGDYSLSLTSPVKLYGGARDATGNSCLKVGSSKATGSFTFTVPEDVDEVVIHVAGYKANTATVSVNGAQYSVSTHSNDGEYTPLVIDTSKTKTVTVATVSGGTRCMINTVEFYTNATEPEITEPVTEPVTEPDVTTEENADGATTTEPTETEPAVTETETENTPITETTDTTELTDTTEATDTAETTDTAEAATTATTPADTQAPPSGCGSVIGCGVVTVSLLWVSAFAYARRKKED